MVLILVACHPKELDLPFETIERQEMSGYQDKKPGLVVIAQQTEEASLEALVTKEIQARLQDTNYKACVVIGVFQGWKPTTRYSVQIERITRRGNAITAHAQLSEPKPGEPTGDLATSPYHLVCVQKIGTWGRTITFNLAMNESIVTSLSHYIP
jgi:hypothetical protein